MSVILVLYTVVHVYLIDIHLFNIYSTLFVSLIFKFTSV